MEQELKLQLALLGIRYQIDEAGIDKINWKRFFIMASNNRVLFYCCKKIIELNLKTPKHIKKNIENEILPKGQEYIKKTKRTLGYLNDNLKNYPFLICKTEKLIEYVTFDVDVLFKKSDYKNALKHLSKLGGEYIDCKKKLQGDIIIKNMLRMDMHDNFRWQKSNFISNKQLWKTPKMEEVFGVRCPIPNLDNEVMLNLLNLIYERHYIPLLDYYFIFNYKDKINWDIIFQTAKDYKWEKALIIILNKFNQIHYFLFKELLMDIGKYKKDYKLKQIKDLKIPFMFTYQEGVSVFMERLIKCHYFRWYEFLYFLFAKTRFHLIKGRKVPIYGHWIDNLK